MTSHCFQMVCVEICHKVLFLESLINKQTIGIRWRKIWRTWDLHFHCRWMNSSIELYFDDIEHRSLTEISISLECSSNPLQEHLLKKYGVPWTVKILQRKCNAYVEWIVNHERVYEGVPRLVRVDQKCDGTVVLLLERKQS